MSDMKRLRKVARGNEACLGALERLGWMVDLLARQRSITWDGSGEYEDYRAAREAAEDALHERLRACSPPEQRAAVLVLMMASVAFDHWFCIDPRERAILRPAAQDWTPAEAAAMVRLASEHRGYSYGEALKEALATVRSLDAEGCRAIVPLLRYTHERLLKEDDLGASIRSALLKSTLSLLAKVDDARIPDGAIPPDDGWAEPLRALAEQPTPEVARLVQHLASLSGPRPSQTWRRRCVALLAEASAGDMPSRVLHRLAEDEPLCSKRHGGIPGWMGDHYHYHYLVHTTYADLARGLVWAAALTSGASADLEKLALRTGARGSDVVQDLKLAGAAINALGAIDGALEPLWRLERGIRDRGLRKQVDAALKVAAAREGITPEQLIERSVPAHGLSPDGTLTRSLGDHLAMVAVEDAATVRLTFTTPDGRTVRSVPAALKESYEAELKELKALVKEVRVTLSAERARLEQLMSADRAWPHDEWARYYRDHPITGVITRDLSWDLKDGTVRLWHPIRATVDEITAKRAALTDGGTRQPFKQAFREIYLLTPAEEETRTYSNRFAAHIVHYRRLYALFKERGWQANFLGSYDGGYDGEARSTFGDGSWRACFYHDPAGDPGDYGPDYAATDQVRFEHNNGRHWAEIPLAEVPPLIFSEAMRDVDLFVGVTSIAADPDWADHGEDRYNAYWRATTFGELTASAEVRRDALARLLPRTKIAGRCSIEGRYLRVRGEIRTYKIHLGSGNILMEPDDSYLCIVPARRSSTPGKVFLPFEDERLSLILSKAFLLADDTRITDASILSQIRGGR